MWEKRQSPWECVRISKLATWFLARIAAMVTPWPKAYLPVLCWPSFGVRPRDVQGDVAAACTCTRPNTGLWAPTELWALPFPSRPAARLAPNCVRRVRWLSAFLARVRSIVDNHLTLLTQFGAKRAAG